MLANHENRIFLVFMKNKNILRNLALYCFTNLHHCAFVLHSSDLQRDNFISFKLSSAISDHASFFGHRSFKRKKNITSSKWSFKNVQNNIELFGIFRRYNNDLARLKRGGERHNKKKIVRWAVSMSIYESVSYDISSSTI